MSETLPVAGEFCPTRPASRPLDIAGDFLALTRPRVLMLVLFTAPAAMAMGREGWPEPALLTAIALGTALIGGGCGALNAWIERERDAKMTRTMHRPLPTGRLDPRQALVFGLFTFLLNFIPSVGSIVATLLPLPVVLMSPAISGTTAVLAIVVPGVIQFGIGSVLEPKLMGSSLDLHPVVILVALIFWGMLWGIPGMFLATPITAVARILLEKIEMTRPVGELLAGRIGGLGGEPGSG
jgi:4-hydroxybenzoate polyprenyltransferase